MLFAGVPHRLEAAVYFGRDESQRFHKARAAKFSGNAERWIFRREPVENCNVLGKDFSVVQNQCRNVALAGYLVENAARSRLLRPGVDALAFERRSGFEQSDMIGQAAGEGAVVEFNVGILPTTNVL